MAANTRPEIGLVSCVKSKRDEPAVPKDLYTSPYFRKMRRFAEAEHDDWWILSAKHGLLDPDGDPIEPYEETLTTATSAEREIWAEEVLRTMREERLVEKPVVLVIHAGKAYTEPLLRMLQSIDTVEIENPTAGLAIGERMSWYNERLD